MSPLFSKMTEEICKQNNNVENIFYKEDLLDEMDAKLDSFVKVSHIEDFYKDQTIFITGATGFLGSLLVEKLLRCCPNINKLILLVRNSKTKNVNKRIEEHFSDEVFDRMKLENPNYYKQVDVVAGDLDKDNFDLDRNDERFIISNTNIIFHVAASVRFNEHIRVAHDINVKGTKTLLSMAKKMKLLKSFVYVSTAYCNCDRKFIDEKFYKPVYTEPELSTLVRVCSDEELAILTDILLDQKPNTYTLTKSTAEDLVREVSHELPICVFRPSIVMPTYKEPLPLWIKGFNSILAYAMASGLGFMRVVLIEPDITIDLVPADRVINALSAVAWYHTTEKCKEEKIFNYVSAVDNSIKLSYFNDFAEEAFVNSEESCDLVMWKNSTIRTKRNIVYYVLFYLLHLVPGVLFATVEKLTKRRSMVMKNYRKLIFLFQAIRYFSVNEWGFSNNNTRAMCDAISDSDRVTFDSSMSNFRWAEMLEFYPRACILYSLNMRLTKESYQKRMVYITRADACIKFISLATSMYLLLGFVAFFLNNYFIN